MAIIHNQAEFNTLFEYLAAKRNDTSQRNTQLSDSIRAMLHTFKTEQILPSDNEQAADLLASEIKVTLPQKDWMTYLTNHRRHSLLFSKEPEQYVKRYLSYSDDSLNCLKEETDLLLQVINKNPKQADNLIQQIQQLYQYPLTNPAICYAMILELIPVLE